MFRPRQWTWLGLVSIVFAALPSVADAAPSQVSTEIATIDLSREFGIRSPWRVTVTQEPPIDDAFGSSGDKMPGALHICLRKDPTSLCDPLLPNALRSGTGDNPFLEPHYLEAIRIVHPRGMSNRPILLLVTASLHSGDGDQLVLTRVLAYRPGLDQFMTVYEHSTGTNNNQEVRYMETGPLQGDIISIEPTEDAPFAFWVAVKALSATYTYKEVLRYRSATRYGDGNLLAVIESEMPSIQQRLGLWRPNTPLPLPATPCLKPWLIKGELWCN